MTNRRTSTTTRAPMTYFGLNEPLGESSSTNLDIDNHDLLNGDYEGVVDYDYYPYDYEPSEVPTGVKSALIASSVVGGLAVSIFLCIFMLVKHFFHKRANITLVSIVLVEADEKQTSDEHGV